MSQVQQAAPIEADPISKTTVTTPSYASAAGRKGRMGARFWVPMVAVAVLGTGASLGLRAGGYLDGIFGMGSADGLYHLVQPMDFNIILTEDGELRAQRSINVKCELDGFQSTVLFVAEESSKVKKGDKLLVFASDKLEEQKLAEESNLSRMTSEVEAATQSLVIQSSQNKSNIEKAGTDLVIAKLDLEKYVKGDFPQKMNTAELDIKQANMEINKRAEDLAKSKKLKEKGFVTESKLKELKFDLERAQMTLAKYELAKHILLTYEEPRDLKQKQTAVSQAEQQYDRVQKESDSKSKQAIAKMKDAESRLALSTARLERIRGELTKTTIYSPADGVIRYYQGGGGHRREEPVAPGKTVYKGQTLLSIPDTSKMVVTTRIHEADRHYVQPGLTCIITVPAAPGKTFTGKLIKVAQYADSANRWLSSDLKEHAAEILLDESDDALSPGDTAEVKILIEDVEHVLAVPVITVFARGARNFVFARRRGGAKPVEIKLGRSNTSFVEVTDGLESGDRVLMHVTDDLLAMLPKVQPGEELARQAKAANAKQGGSRRPASSERRMGSGRGRPGGAASGRPAAGSTARGRRPTSGGTPSGDGAEKRGGGSGGKRGGG